MVQQPFPYFFQGGCTRQSSNCSLESFRSCLCYLLICFFPYKFQAQSGQDSSGLSRGKSSADLTFFEDKGVVAGIREWTPSPSPKASPSDAAAVPAAEKNLLKATSVQAVASLPQKARSRFQQFGSDLEKGKYPMTLTTLCSGCDCAVDTLEDSSAFHFRVWDVSSRQKRIMIFSIYIYIYIYIIYSHIVDM